MNSLCSHTLRAIWLSETSIWIFLYAYCRNRTSHWATVCLWLLTSKLHSNELRAEYSLFIRFSVNWVNDSKHVWVGCINPFTWALNRYYTRIGTVGRTATQSEQWARVNDSIELEVALRSVGFHTFIALETKFAAKNEIHLDQCIAQCRIGWYQWSACQSLGRNIGQIGCWKTHSRRSRQGDVTKSKRNLSSGEFDSGHTSSNKCHGNVSFQNDNAVVRGIMLLEKYAPCNAIISAGGIGFQKTTLSLTSVHGGGIDVLIRFFIKWKWLPFYHYSRHSIYFAQHDTCIQCGLLIISRVTCDARRKSPNRITCRKFEISCECRVRVSHGLIVHKPNTSTYTCHRRA